VCGGVGGGGGGGGGEGRAVGSSLPCELVSLMELRRIVDFFSLLSFLLVVMGKW